MVLRWTIRQRESEIITKKLVCSSRGSSHYNDNHYYNNNVYHYYDYNNYHDYVYYYHD